MVTMVGKQTHFTNALQELLELDYDAIEAYEMAINKIENNQFKSKLNDFKMDHQGHIIKISAILRKHDAKVPTTPSAKQWLAKGKVFLGGLIGDNAILLAMLTNEEDTNEAYERILNRPDLWPDAAAFVEKGLQDEKRHKSWLQAVIKE